MGIRHDAVTVYGSGFHSPLGNREGESCEDLSQETCLYAEFQIRSLRIVLRICKPQITNLMIGPPSDPANDSMYMNRFFQLPGRHIICGGTTAHIAANLLGKTLHTISGSGLDDIPAAMELDGVDYITEGQLTLKRLLEYCREWDDDPVDFLSRKKSTNPAMKLMDYLFSKSMHINIFFGSAENQSQRELQLTSEAKQRKVEELIAHLKKQGKIVNNAYWAI